MTIEERQLREGISLICMDRLPPHSHENEQAFLGACLMDVEQLDEHSHVAVDAFYDLRHGMIWKGMLELREKHEPVNIQTVYVHLRETGLIDKVGGIAYVASLPDKCALASHAEYHAKILLQKSAGRKMLQACTAGASAIFEREAELETVLQEIEAGVLAVNEGRSTTETLHQAPEMVAKTIDTLEAAYLRDDTMRGIPTGLTDLDAITNGLHDGELIILAARPSMGKTSLAMNIVEHVAVDLGLPVGVFSLEMVAAGQSSLMERLICSRARVNARAFASKQVSESDFSRVTIAAGQIKASPLYIDDASSLSVLNMRSKARRMKSRFGIKLIVVDYLQLMQPGRKCHSVDEAIGIISSNVKAMAKELCVPVILLSQLNRDQAREGNRRPKLSDLRSSGNIEQDADVCCLLWNQAADDKQDEQADSLAVVCIVAKQRNGPTGDVPLVFRKHLTRFENAQKV